jgi:hypothetical protein
MQSNPGGILNGALKLFGMHNIDTVMKKAIITRWYNRKKEKIYAFTSKEIICK